MRARAARQTLSTTTSRFERCFGRSSGEQIGGQDSGPFSHRRGGRRVGGHRGYRRRRHACLVVPIARGLAEAAPD
jgi:hypothetical protein